jgi:hypothetical protein
MQPTSHPVDNRSLTIGVLSITACVLFVGLILTLAQPKPAYGIGQIDRTGDYIMLTQQVTNSQELCVIIDSASRQMALYAYNSSNRQIQLLQNIQLSDMPSTSP